MPTSFAVTYDYRCPFARIAHDHLVTALRDGADWEVTFVPLSLGQLHVAEGQPDVWDTPGLDKGLLALQASVAVRDDVPEQFLDAHDALFDARHGRGISLATQEDISTALEGVGVDAGRVFELIDSGGPLATVRKEHEQAVDGHNAWGVPTFLRGDNGVFVRLMSGPGGDGATARRTIEKVLGLIDDFGDLNEFKHTRIRAEPPYAGPMAEREIRADRRMTDVEAMMWNIEKDPFLSSTFGSVTILDRPPDFERFRRRLGRMAVRIPRLHQKVSPSLGRLSPPEWTDDPSFDLDFHVRRMALPSPGSIRDLYDFATTFVQAPFDRTRPLWEFCVIEGLEGGKGALVQKMHHTITDGEGGIRMSEQFVDISRDAPDIAEEPLDLVPPVPTTLLDSAVEAFSHTYRRGLGMAQRSVGVAVGTVVHPSRLPAMGGEVAETARSAVRQLTVTDQAHSPLWRDRSLRRRFETLDVPFDEAKRAAKNLGGSLNDFFVCGTAGGAGRYHLALGAEADRLRMAMPVSTRSDRSAGGNSFAPTRMLVPVQVDDPVARFSAIHTALDQTKHERAIGLVGAAAGLVNLLPTSVLVRFARQQTETIDFTTSNVRAAPFDLYMGGAHVEGTYPLGPIAGTAFNLTMMSYCGALNMGLHIDSGAIEQPELLRDWLADAFDELIAAGS